ncbi:MAG: hypothetical protein ACLSAP_11025 [Oscillospiraceae bacterium]
MLTAVGLPITASGADIEQIMKAKDAQDALADMSMTNDCYRWRRSQHHSTAGKSPTAGQL